MRRLVILLLSILYFGCNEGKIENSDDETLNSLKWFKENQKSIDSSLITLADSQCLDLLKGDVNTGFSLYYNHVHEYYGCVPYILKLYSLKDSLTPSNKSRYNYLYIKYLFSVTDVCKSDSVKNILDESRSLISLVPKFQRDSFTYLIQINQLALYTKLNLCKNNAYVEPFIKIADSCLRYLVNGPKDTAIIINTYSTLGAYYFHLGLYNQTEKALIEESKYLNNDTSGLMRVIHNKSFVMIMNNDTVKALKYSKECLRLAKAQNPPDYKSLNMAYNGMHEYYRYFGNEDSLKYYSRKIDNIIDELQPTERLDALLFSISSLTPKKALERLIRIEEETKNNAGMDRYAHLLEEKSRLYSELGNYKLAYENILVKNELVEKTFGKEKSIIVAELENKFAIADKDRKIAEKQNEINLSEKENERMKKWTAFIGIFVLILFGALLFYREKINQKKKALIEEEYKNLLLENLEHKEIQVAKELHDVVGQDIVSTIYCLKEAKYEQANEHLNETIQNIRRIVRNMHPIELENTSIKQLLEKLLRNVEAKSKLEVSFFIQDIELEEDNKLQLYRIVQEGLTNIMKHAKARSINVVLNKENEIITLMIEDDGKGFNLNQIENAFGIPLIKQRASSINGEIKIRTKPGKGTQIKVKFNG